MILAGDIGGTHSRFGLFRPQQGPREPVRLQVYATREEDPPAEMVARFLGGVPVDGVTIAVAGAVLDGEAEGSNLPWPVRKEDIERRLEAVPVRLLNDLEAVAAILPELREPDVETLQQGQPDARGSRGVIAPGTGMGQAMSFWDRDRYVPRASEAGHVDFAAADELQDGYLRFLRARFGHVSLERACSGGSLPLLREYVVAEELAAADPEIAAAIEAADDPTPVIFDAGLEDACAACTLTLDTFVAILGAAAGNLALQIVATGGIYLGGGIPPRILPALRSRTFLEGFRSKGRFRPLVERVPVRVILEQHAGIQGAARVALDEHLPV